MQRWCLVRNFSFLSLLGFEDGSIGFRWYSAHWHAIPGLRNGIWYCYLTATSVFVGDEYHVLLRRQQSWHDYGLVGQFVSFSESGPSTVQGFWLWLCISSHLKKNSDNEQCIPPCRARHHAVTCSSNIDLADPRRADYFHSTICTGLRMVSSFA